RRSFRLSLGSRTQTGIARQGGRKMNSLFVDEVTKAKSQVTGSMPADRAVARVNALDWQEIGDRTLSGQTGFPVIRAKLNSSALFGHCVLYSGYRVFK